MIQPISMNFKQQSNKPKKKKSKKENKQQGQLGN